MGAQFTPRQMARMAEMATQRQQRQQPQLPPQAAQVAQQALGSAPPGIIQQSAQPPPARHGNAQFTPRQMEQMSGQVRGMLGGGAQTPQPQQPPRDWSAMAGALAGMAGGGHRPKQQTIQQPQGRWSGAMGSMASQAFGGLAGGASRPDQQYRNTNPQNRLTGQSSGGWGRIGQSLAGLAGAAPRRKF